LLLLVCASVLCLSEPLPSRAIVMPIYKVRRKCLRPVTGHSARPENDPNGRLPTGWQLPVYWHRTAGRPDCRSTGDHGGQSLTRLERAPGLRESSVTLPAEGSPAGATLRGTEAGRRCAAGVPWRPRMHPTLPGATRPARSNAPPRRPDRGCSERRTGPG